MIRTEQAEILLPAMPRGLHLITAAVEEVLRQWNTGSGVLHVFLKHTSAGICINENYDPSVRHDLERALDLLAPENAPYYTHTLEGPDDMPAHIKAMLSGVSLHIPVTDGRLNLGTWQGIYLCEFRNRGGRRKLVVTYTGK
ncbi:MAG: YjbQ family protein [Chlorobi bacterium]|nr:YjbQ family protein [Chlorobiota bacterium]